MPKIYSRYDVPQIPGISITTPSMTQQQFKEESDINNIIANYCVTGCLTDPFVKPTRMPMYGDYSEIPDFATAQNVMIQASEDFMKLPSNIRKEFQNDPNLFLEFMQNPNNYERAVELGLCERKAPVVEPEPIVTPAE